MRGEDVFSDSNDRNHNSAPSTARIRRQAPDDAVLDIRSAGGGKAPMRQLPPAPMSV